MKQTSVELLIEQIKSKADNLPTNTKENRMAKGIYVDCLIMAREAKKIEEEQKGYSEEEVEKLIRITYQETMRAMVDWFKNNKDKTPQDAESAIINYVYPRLAEKGIKFKNK